MLNTSIHFRDQQLYCDDVRVADIVAQVGTPAYIYSLKRVLANYERTCNAFAHLNAHIHYSAKANANLALLRTLVEAGAGIDCVSGGEIYKALRVGCRPEKIVFAGVGKTTYDLAYAVENRVGWINIENEAECATINRLASERGQTQRVALRYNPDVAANTIRQIATGHNGAKFGLSTEAVQRILNTASDYPFLQFEGIHVHIGSQLGDTTSTEASVRSARSLIAPYPHISTIDIGGGVPTPYRDGQPMCSVEDFTGALSPLLDGYEVIVEPGRSIVADAGILVAEVLYIKQHGGQTFIILDTGMTELIRPALYEAHHEIVPLDWALKETTSVEIVGPVCETTDVLAHARQIPLLSPGDHVALLTAGAYGFVMASSYNARPRPPEIVVHPDGQTWHIARRRETWEDLIAEER
jgi:diaminopimelate decarboxylase